MTTIYAFFDLEASGYDFEFANFLAMAEMERRRAEADKLHIVFVREESGGLHRKVHGDDLRDWRMTNLLIPLCGLVESRPDYSVYADRQAAADYLAALSQSADSIIYPEGYTVASPVVKWSSVWMQVYGNFGEDLHWIAVPRQALNYVTAWTENNAVGGKFVTLTLRNSPINPQRNSDLAAWGALADRLRANGYTPVVVPDTDTGFAPLPSPLGDFPQFLPAAFNLELRAALYERAYVNLFVSNGAGALCWFNRHAAFIQFISGEWARNPAQQEKYGGFTLDKYPPFFTALQRICWVGQDVDAMWSAFASLASDIEAGAEPVKRPGEPGTPAVVERHATVLERMSRHRLWEPFDYVARRAIAEEPRNPLLHRLVAQAEIARRDQGEARDPATLRRAYERCVALVRDIPPADRTESDWQVVAEAQSALGQADALEAALRARFDAPDAPPAVTTLLCDLLAGQSRLAAAADTCRRAIARGAETPENYVRLAGYARAIGQIDAARAAAVAAETLVRSGLSGDADRVGPLLELGKYYLSSGEPAAAVQLYRDGIDAIGPDPALLIGLGNALQRNGEAGPAADTFRSCLDLDDRQFAAYDGLGRLYEAQRDYGAAAELYHAAVQRGVASFDMVSRFGVLLFTMDQFDAAEDVFHWLADQKPDDAAIVAWIDKIADAKAAQP